MTQDGDCHNKYYALCETVREDYTGGLALLDKKIVVMQVPCITVPLCVLSQACACASGCSVPGGVDLIPDCEKLMSSGDCLIVQEVIERTFK